MEQGNNYVVQLKANCNKRYREATTLADNATPLSTYCTVERQKGRLEIRTVKVFAWLAPLIEGWQTTQINTLIVVERHTERDGKSSDKRHFYVSNFQHKARYFATLIRGHWSIENQLHWVKDVIQQEDNATISEPNAAQNVSILKNVALNVYRQHGFTSLKHAIIRFANKVPQLALLLHAF